MENVRMTELTADLIVDGVKADDPVISPDGHWVAWTTSSASGPGQRTRELWVAPVGPDAVPVKAGPGRLPRWSPDSGSLWHVAEEGLRRLRLGADGPVAEAETVLPWQGEISGVAPLADGRRVALMAADEMTDEDERRRDAGDDALAWSERAERQPWRWHRLRVLDVDSGELRALSGLAGRHVTGLSPRPDGAAIAVVSWDCPDYDPGVFTARLHITDPGDGSAADVCAVGLEAQSLAWWRGPDGWHVSWLEAQQPAYATAAFDVAVATGHPENLTADLAVCPDVLAQVTDGPPLALFAEGLDTGLYRLEPASRSFQRMTGWPGRVSALSASDDAMVIAVVASTAHTPPDVSAGRPEDLIPISDTRPELRGVELGTQERLSWRAPDGLELDGVLILPPGRGRSDGPFPLVTMIHGGPYGRSADDLKLSWVWWGQWLAAAGFAVFHPNPRGGQGHGQAFAAKVGRAVGQDEWTDVLTGIDALVADGVADPDRLGIAGWSHGGFMAAWAVTQTDRFRAAVMGAGIADWAIQVAVGDFGRSEAALCGSHGWEGPGPLHHDRLSPISYATKVTTPVLILHGENDTNVPVSQAVYFHRALMDCGAEHDLVIYPRENHGITERAHQIDVLERVRAWFTRWLPVPSAPAQQ
jgi:dipeptidyl aminopeptidase/acylaminoacyl peptidase